MTPSRLTDHAAFVFERCNYDYFVNLLKAIETSARDLGLEVGPAMCSAYDEADFLTMAAAVNQARRAYLSPTLDPEIAARSLKNDMEDGYAQMWLTSILSALQDRGIYLHRPMRHTDADFGLAIDPAVIATSPPSP